MNEILYIVIIILILKTLSVKQQRPRSIAEMFEVYYASSFRFGAQLVDFRFGSRGCTSFQTFLFIFTV